MRWGDFEKAEPDLAQRCWDRFERDGVVVLGTVRKDGSPRISPVETLVMDGELYSSMMWQSRKALDLLRDPRCVVHSSVSSREGKGGDFKVYSRAVDVQDPELRERYGQALFRKIGWRPKGPYHLFSFQIESVGYVTFDSEELVARCWTPEKGLQVTRKVRPDEV